MELNLNKTENPEIKPIVPEAGEIFEEGPTLVEQGETAEIPASIAAETNQPAQPVEIEILKPVAIEPEPGKGAPLESEGQTYKLDPEDKTLEKQNLESLLKHAEKLTTNPSAAHEMNQGAMDYQ